MHCITISLPEDLAATIIDAAERPFPSWFVTP